MTGEKARIQLVYGGIEDGFKDKKLRHVYFEIVNDVLDDKPLYFGKMLGRHRGKPGMLLSCDRWLDEDGDFRFGDVKVGGRWRDKNWVAAYHARDLAVKEARSKIRERYKDRIKEQLKPLKEVYVFLTPRQKRAMLAMIMEYLSKKG